MNGDAILKIAEQNPDVVIRDEYAQNARKGTVERPGAAKAQKTDKHTAPAGSVLESRFLALWEIAGCPPLEREYRFDEVRKWRFDFAHPATQVAIEIEGILYRKTKNGQTVSRHQHPKGYEDDCEKYNTATLGGWQVYRLTSEMITDEWCNRIADVIRTTEAMNK